MFWIMGSVLAGYMLRYQVCGLVVGGLEPIVFGSIRWNSDGVFGRFELAALCGCRTLLNVCYVMLCLPCSSALGIGTLGTAIGHSCLSPCGLQAGHDCGIV